METRQVTEVKMYFLVMNVVGSKIPNVACMSYDEGELEKYYEEEKVKPYKTDLKDDKGKRVKKHFRETSALEMYEPLEALNKPETGLGVFSKWILQSEVRTDVPIIRKAD